MKLEEMPKILKTRDVARLLDLSPDNVNVMARKGLIPAYKEGNQWRFRRQDLEPWLKENAAKLPS
ncbi:MAG: helix-turn-helix domain-containing protein [Deltaproteobacteria bacterium]|nr:helix-turn-helix domain-containing protein [Deltaproteobacteria bacterium]